MCPAPIRLELVVVLIGFQFSDSERCCDAAVHQQVGCSRGALRNELSLGLVRCLIKAPTLLTGMMVAARI